MVRALRLAAALSLLVSVSACGSSAPSGPPTRSVVIAWNASRESGVNRAGGGYRVLVDAGPSIDVPWVSGPSAPTSITAQLTSGTHTVTVFAYAALDAQGGLSGTTSGPSESIQVAVP